MNDSSINTSCLKLLLGFLLISYSPTLFSQPATFTRNLDSLYSISDIDSLKSLYGHNKTLPSAFEYQVLLALSYYPELDNSKIVFKERRIKTTMNTRPTFWSMFAKNKKYIIRINSKLTHPILLRNVPFNASIGLLGHEFAHILDYRRKNFFGIFKRGIDYTSKRRKADFEKEVDIITIEKGLGWQLYDWSYFVLNQSMASEKYKAFKRLTYLTPEEIKQRINTILE